MSVCRTPNINEGFQECGQEDSIRIDSRGTMGGRTYTCSAAIPHATPQVVNRSAATRSDAAYTLSAPPSHCHQAWQQGRVHFVLPVETPLT